MAREGEILVVTKKNVLDVFENPFRQMLVELATIPGYNEYLNWLSGRVKVDQSWQAEIKSLYEINKKNHPLVHICSPDENEPEGIFLISGKQGILEAAYIGYKFDANVKKEKYANLSTGLFHNFREVTAESNWLVVIIASVDSPPSLDDVAIIKGHLTGNQVDNNLKKTSYGYYGYFDSQPNPKQIEELVPQYGLGFVYNKNGSLFINLP